MGAECQIFLIDQRWGQVRKQSKKATNFANISQNGKPLAGNVLISSFLLSTGGQGFEQSHFKQLGRGAGFSEARPFCMITITKATKSKSYEQFQHGVRIGFFSAKNVEIMLGRL